MNINNYVNNKNSIIKYIIVVILTLLAVWLFNVISELYSDIKYSSNNEPNDFTKFECSRSQDIIICDLIMTKNVPNINYVSLDIEYDNELEYKYSNQNSNTSFRYQNKGKKTTLDITRTFYEEDVVKNNTLLTLVFKEKAHSLGDKIITVDNMYISSNNDGEYTSYDYDYLNPIEKNTSKLPQYDKKFDVKFECFDNEELYSCKFYSDKDNFNTKTISFDLASNGTMINSYISPNCGETISHNTFQSTSHYELNDIYTRNNEDSIIIFNFPDKYIDLIISNLYMEDYEGNIYTLNEQIKVKKD